MAKKKTPGEEYLDATKAYSDEARRIAQENAAVAEAAGNAQIADLSAAQEAQQAANQSAMDMYRQRMNEGYTSFADLIDDRDRQMAQENLEAQNRINADKRNARWAGATELASSIANLIAVGGHNAVNQNYKNFSQDWMRKADQEMREHRMRMDNLRERQNALKQQLTQLKMGDAGTALAQAQKDAERAYQYRTQLGQMRYNNAVAPAQLRAQGEEKAAAAQLQGVERATSFDLQRRAQDISAQQHADTMALNLAKAGMMKDAKGNIVPDKNSEIGKASQKKPTSGSGNTYYYTDKDGNLVPVKMSASEYDKFVEQSYAKLKSDPEFLKQYKMQTNDLDRKSLIYLYAQQDPERRAVLSQYGDNPERNYQAEPTVEEGNNKDKEISTYWSSLRSGGGTR